jgi:hypothetical protein
VGPGYLAAMVAEQPKLIGTTINGMTISSADMFEYNDSVDGSISKNQGIRFMFSDGSRFVFRLSGTGVVGATIRLYLEKYTPPTGDLSLHAFDVIKPLGEIALQVGRTHHVEDQVGAAAVGGRVNSFDEILIPVGDHDIGVMQFALKLRILAVLVRSHHHAHC